VLDMNKQALINTFALVYKEYNFPPTAGKILGFFFVNSQRDFTFNEVMVGIQASKSATSKALKFLVNIEEVNFKFSEVKKRKRLFFLNNKSVKRRNEKLIKAHSLETNLLKQCLNVRKDENSEIYALIKSNVAFNEDMIQFATDKLYSHFETEQNSTEK